MELVFMLAAPWLSTSQEDTQIAAKQINLSITFGTPHRAPFPEYYYTDYYFTEYYYTEYYFTE